MSLLLKAGSTGPHVTLLQQLLNFLTMANPPLATDGIFGPKTKAAVHNFQKSANLAVDGIVGPMTGQALVGATFVRLIKGV